MARMIKCLMVALAGAVLLAGCAAQRVENQPPSRKVPATPAAIRAAVAATTARLPQYREVTGHWQGEQASSTFHAYFDSGRLQYVMETAGDDGQGYAVNKYYYDRGTLYYFHGQGSVGRGDALNPRPADIDVQLAFGARGRLTRSDKRLNGRNVPLEKGEAAAILEHAGKLRQQAKATLAKQTG